MGDEEEVDVFLLLLNQSSHVMRKSTVKHKVGSVIESNNKKRGGAGTAVS